MTLPEQAAPVMSYNSPEEMRRRLLTLAKHLEPKWRPAAEGLVPLLGKLPGVVPMLSRVLGVQLPDPALRALHLFQHLSLDSWESDLAAILARVPDDTLREWVQRFEGVSQWVAKP